MPKGFAGIKDITSFPTHTHVFSKDMLDKKLAALKLSPKPPPKPRAMCYSLKRPNPEDLKSFSYVCPVCGKRTVHRIYEWNNLFELDQIRDAAQLLRDRGFDIYLVEKNLCSNCKDSTAELGKLLWKITIEERTFYVQFYSWKNDCIILSKFLSCHSKTDYDKLMNDLDGNLSRLEVLLGRGNA